MAVNDEIFKNLEVYGGGTINERVYNFLGSLGYTGTINDRLGQFEEGGRKGWQGLIRAWGQWAPAQLFSQGQQGVWYEPRPQYLYQDAAGTTPVEADGDPVGLMLDRHKGLALGPELVSNGDASDGITGWSAVSATLTASNGKFNLVADPGGRAQTNITCKIGSYYRVKASALKLSGSTGTRIRLYVVQDGTQTVLEENSANSTHDYSAVFLATSSSVSLRIEWFNFSTGGEFEFDNVTTKELPGKHLTQPTSADRPTYGTDGVIHWLGFDGAGDQHDFPRVTFSGALTISLAARFDATSDTDMILGAKIGTTSGPKIGIAAGGYFSRLADSTTSLTGGTTDINPHVLTVTRDGSNVMRMYLDGGLLAQQSGISGDSVFDILGASYDDADSLYKQFYQGNCYGVVMASGLESRERIEGYLAKLAGITL